MILLNGFPPEKKIFVGSLGSAYSLKFRNLTAPFFFQKGGQVDHGKTLPPPRKQYIFMLLCFVFCLQYFVGLDSTKKGWSLGW